MSKFELKDDLYFEYFCINNFELFNIIVNVDEIILIVIFTFKY